jgi:hypothetical protein
MAKPLTNDILASILYLIRRDIIRNEWVPPRRAPPRWVPPHWASACRRHHHPRRSGPRARDTTPTVLTHGTVTIKGTREVAAWATTAIVWHTLHPTITSWSWTAGRATGGRQFFHGGHTKKNPCNRRIRKGVIGGGAPDKGHGRSFDHRLTGYTLPQTRSNITNTRRCKP